jgi:hypothetical protein
MTMQEEGRRKKEGMEAREGISSFLLPAFSLPSPITQADLDRLPWFHDFIFPNGLVARSTDYNNAAFRAMLWRFIGETLRELTLAGQTVLEVGCWDGYFSFLADWPGPVRPSDGGEVARKARR